MAPSEGRAIDQGSTRPKRHDARTGPAARATTGVLPRAARAWKASPREAAACIGSLVLQQAFFVFFASSLKVIVDDVAEQRATSRLAVVLTMLLVGFAAAAGASVVGERMSARAAARIFRDIRERLYLKVLRLSRSYVQTTSPDSILARFTNDLRSLEGGYVQGFLDTVVLAISALITVPLLFWFDWRLALITCLALPLVVVVVDRLLPRWVRADAALSAADLKVVGSVRDTLRAHELVQTFHLEGRLTDRFDELLDAQSRASIRARGLAAAVAKGASMGALLVQVIVVVVGAELAVRGRLTAGTLVAFVTVLALLARTVYNYARVDLPLLADAGAAITSLGELLDAPVGVEDAPHAQALPPVSGAISFEKVSFSYLADRPAVVDVSFEIPARSSAAVVGPNGSGKSSILNLLMRLYDPQTGVVRMDGTDVRSVTQRSFRSQMSVVLQGTLLFNDTIRANIRIGNPDANDDEVVVAAQRAELHDFVTRLPDGYETMVGEDGGMLSGGQRQRLAIARAMIRDPRVLLVDEVTTALDPATEASVTATLVGLASERTVVSVTHRLAMASRADQILVFDRGRLVEHGSHDELLAHRGLYRGLWDKQSGFEVSGDGRHATVDAARLRHVTLFTGLTDSTLSHIALGLTSEYFEAGHTVFHAGQPGDRFYLIARGRVEVIATNATGDEHLLEVLSDGDHFGELALLQDRPRTATIRTATPCVFLTMDRKDFLALVASTPEMGHMLERRMAQSELNLDEWRRLVGEGRA